MGTVGAGQPQLPGEDKEGRINALKCDPDILVAWCVLLQAVKGTPGFFKAKEGAILRSLQAVDHALRPGRDFLCDPCIAGSQLF